MKFNVTRSSMPDFEEYCEEIKSIWDTRWLTNMGEKHQKFQSGLEDYLGVSGVSLFANGHLALESIISAMDFPSGAEVITTPFTFISTVNAIVRCGLKPVFCDINKENYTIDVTKIEELITDKTCAIVPVHVYGNLCDDKALSEIAEKHRLKVIYDAAHAFGVEQNGKSVAQMGDASIFSFHATKVMHSIEGGAVCCRDSSILQKLDEIKNFGITKTGDCMYVGGNSKLSEFHAAMGICNLRHIDDEIEKRKLAVMQYRKRLSDIDGIILPDNQNGVKQNYAYMPVVFDGFMLNRDEIHQKLKDFSIFSRMYFYPAVNDMSAYSSLSFNTPIAREISQKVLCLPLYAELSSDDVDYICDIILNF